MVPYGLSGRAGKRGKSRTEQFFIQNIFYGALFCIIRWLHFECVFLYSDTVLYRTTWHGTWGPTESVCSVRFWILPFVILSWQKRELSWEGSGVCVTWHHSLICGSFLWGIPIPHTEKKDPQVHSCSIYEKSIKWWIEVEIWTLFFLGSPGTRRRCQYVIHSWGELKMKFLLQLNQRKAEATFHRWHFEVFVWRRRPRPLRYVQPKITSCLFFSQRNEVPSNWRGGGGRGKGQETSSLKKNITHTSYIAVSYKTLLNPKKVRFLFPLLHFLSYHVFPFRPDKVL